MDAAVFEVESGAFGQITNRFRGEDLAGASRGHDSRANGHCDPANLGADLLHLTDMEAGADLKAQRLHALDRLECARRRRGGSVEDGKEAVARGIHLAPTMALQGSADDLVVLLHEFTPAAIPQLGDHFGRADDVREEDGRKEALGLAPRHGADSDEALLPLQEFR